MKTQDNYKHELPSLAVAGLLLAVGLLVTFIGSAHSMDFALALGGAVIGAGFAAVSNWWKDLRYGREIDETIRGSLSSKFSSVESEIEDFRSVYHFYYRTRSEKRPVFWRYVKVDFSTIRIPGQLLASVEIENPDSGEPERYTLRGAVRGHRLIILIEKYREQPGVNVFPLFAPGFSGYKCGFLFHEDYSGSQALDPVLICRNPEKEAGVDEIIVDDERIAFLENLWLEQTKRLNVSSIRQLFQHSE